MKDTFIISERDNVGVRLTDGDGIKAGHKFALCDIGEGEPVIKYGEIIGRATCDIKKGEVLNTHMTSVHRTCRGRRRTSADFGARAGVRVFGTIYI